MVFHINIKSQADAQEINQIATKYPFDIWLHGKSGQVDAKSILGLMLLGLENDISLVVEDDVDYKHLQKDIEKYLG
ncbi:MAG: HPr family phosphocarrier protein [Oscillospiraceae bacterium]|jgi:phosphotransferase system HPr-like phosphotransfer protein|nr:HPr family phosphocarrier protein [Oscillospiraceae bacterium]